MKPKTLILMLVAVACGLVAAIVAVNMGSTAPQVDTVPVVVAKVPLAAGMPIRDPMNQLELKPFPKSLAPVNFLSNPVELAGKVPARALSPNEPVRLADMSSIDQLFPKDVKPGYRAFTVRVNMESGLAGFLLPGARVDLMCQLTDLKDARVKQMVTFLQNVEVLAVNQLRTATSDTGTLANPTVVTLMASAEEVQRIAWVTDQRQVAISLRKPGDETIVKLTGAVNPFGKDEKADPSKPEEETVAVPVAKDDIPPGRHEIDQSNVDQFFTVVQMPKTLVPGKPILDKGLIRGRINHLVAQGCPITEKHLEQEKPPVPGEKPVFSVLRITEADKPTATHRYHKGRLVDGAGVSTENAPEKREALPIPAPGKTPEPSEGIKEN